MRTTWGRLPFFLAFTSVLALCSAGGPARAQPPGTQTNRPLLDPDRLRQAAMNQGGDAKRGEAVYLSTAAKCAACHKVRGQGADVGPDLSQIGGKFDRTHLIESIL